MFRAFVLATSMALAAVGTAAAQDPGRSNFEAGSQAYDRGEYAEAMNWYRMAADQGDADAQNSVGLMYLLGRGVPQNDAEAVRWLRMAADQGLAEAQFVLGFLYSKGRGVPQNDTEAVRWYRMAADQGNSQGQLSLGHRYLHGEGVPTNYVEAYKWFALSAAQGNVFASTPRDFVLEKMTPAQIAEGQRLVAAWRPS